VTGFSLALSFDDFRSSPTLPGTVQLTPDGTLYILHRDCQVSGGYPRIAILDDFSLNVLAQLKIGQSFRMKMREN